MKAGGLALISALLVIVSQNALAADDHTQYLLHCSGCHGAAGHGLPENGIPDLHDAGRWAKLPAGREYLVQVPGIAATGISDPLAASLLNYALKTFSADQLKADFQPFTADEVRRYRIDLATDAEKRRRQLDAALARVGH